MTLRERVSRRRLFSQGARAGKAAVGLGLLARLGLSPAARDAVPATEPAAGTELPPASVRAMSEELTWLRQSVQDLESGQRIAAWQNYAYDLERQVTKYEDLLKPS